MGKKQLFGVNMTIVMGPDLIPEMKNDTSYDFDPLYDQVEAACENFVKLLQADGLDAHNYEAMKNAEIEKQDDDTESDPPSASDFPASDPRILIDADWMLVEEMLDEYDCLPLTVRLPLMEMDKFSETMKIVSKAVNNTYSDELSAFDANDIGLSATLAYETHRPDFLGFMMNAPESAWRALHNRLYTPQSTTIRQLCGPNLMRDIMFLGRENVSPHSINNAFKAPRKKAFGAFGSEGSDIATLKHFSAGSLLGMSEYDELKPTLLRIAHDFEGRDPLEAFNKANPLAEKIFDRFIVALNWAGGLKDRLDLHRVISHGELSNEGSTQVLVRLDGEVVMFLSEESGWLSVPDDSGEPGRHFMQSAGFSISDSDVIFPLISLDLAEISRVEGFEYQLPIPSKAYRDQIKILAASLDKMQLIETPTLEGEKDLKVDHGP